MHFEKAFLLTGIKSMYLNSEEKNTRKMFQTVRVSCLVLL